MMESYITKSGTLVFYYCPVKDDYEKREKEALIKHNLVGTRIAIIGVTAKTDFLKRENKIFDTDFIKKHVNVKRRRVLTVNGFGLTPPPIEK